MENDQPVCARCHTDYTMDWSDEPTKYCDNCAHLLIEELEARETLVQKVVQTQRLIDQAYLNHEPTGNLRIELRT